MSDDHQFMEVYLDLLSNQPRNDQTREDFKQILRQRLEEHLSASVERIWELPPIILREPFGAYIELLREARNLFLDGYFYSCVAMCGIVGERLIKDVLRASVQIEKDGQVQRPKDTAFNQFERVDISSIVKFLNKAELISDEALKAADGLIELRNGYAHARGKEPDVDAIRAIKQLHILVEDTVSVFKHFEVKDGALVKKADRPKRDD